jgi:hypothetical protein
MGVNKKLADDYRYFLKLEFCMAKPCCKNCGLCRVQL